MRKLLLGVAVVGSAAAPLALRPVNAAPVGGGPLTGTIAYAGAGLPSTGCAPSSFHISVEATVALEAGGETFAGPVSLEGNGQTGSAEYNSCEAVWGGSGTLAVSALGGGDGGTLECQDLSGYWGRNLAQGFFGSVSGSCLVNGEPVHDMAFVVHGAWAPHPVGAGVTSNVTSASLAGTLQYERVEELCDLPEPVRTLWCTAPIDWLPEVPPIV